MPSIASEYTAQIEGAVRDLKQDRDTWKAVALEYKAAFEGQTARLQELQDICFATQAELENERAHRHTHASSQRSPSRSQSNGHVLGGGQTHFSYGSATISPPHHHESELQHQPTGDSCFGKAQEWIDQRNYDSALLETDRLLRGSLPITSRLEGLLLKSTILCKINPDELYNALAACSEALALCNHLSDLESFVSRIRYQQGVCYYQLSMLDEARDAFATIGETESLHTKASEYRRSCEDQLESLHLPDRRPGFEERRPVAEGLLGQLEQKGLDFKRRRTGPQVRLRALSKPKHLSLPHRWTVARSAYRGQGN